MKSVAAPAFLNGRVKGGQDIFRGQAYMVANNALSQHAHSGGASFPSGSGRSPDAKCNWVNSGPRNERFLTCQSGNLNYSVQENSLLFLLLVH